MRNCKIHVTYYSKMVLSRLQNMATFQICGQVENHIGHLSIPEWPLPKNIPILGYNRLCSRNPQLILGNENDFKVTILTLRIKLNRIRTELYKLKNIQSPKCDSEFPNQLWNVSQALPEELENWCYNVCPD